MLRMLEGLKKNERVRGLVVECFENEGTKEEDGVHAGREEVRSAAKRLKIPSLLWSVVWRARCEEKRIKGEERKMKRKAKEP
jgi:hypothetical protein